MSPLRSSIRPSPTPFNGNSHINKKPHIRSWGFLIWYWRQSDSLRLLDLFDKYRNRVEQVTDDTVIGNVEDRGFAVFVDRHDRARVLHPDDVLDRAGDTEGDINFGRDGLSGRSDLAI